MRKLLSRLLLALVLCIGLAPIKAFATPGEEGQVEKAIISYNPAQGSDVDALTEQIIANGLAGDQDFIEKLYTNGLEAIKKPAQTPTQAVKTLALIQAQAYLSQKSTLDLIASYKAEHNTSIEYHAYWAGNILVISAPQDLLEKIKQLPEYKSLSKDGTIIQDPVEKPLLFGSFRSAPADPREVEENLKLIRADKVWSELNIDGSGVTVGVVDQKVDIDHPALKTKFRGYDSATGTAVTEGNYLDLVSSPYPSDHGTHVTGIILGSETRGPAGSSFDYNRIGVAPGANFIVASAFRDGVGASNENIIKACQWMMAPGGDPAKAPKIVNHSWSDGSNKIDPWFDDMARQMRAVGILNVMSSGNNGSELAPSGSLDNPSGLSDIFTVGACDLSGSVASFSRRGPVANNASLIKPDVVAPGVGVRSSVYGGGYASWDGTSMAAPHVAGVAALVWSANPDLSLDEVEAILRESAQIKTDSSYPSSPNMAYGYGQIDAYNAVSMALGKMNQDDTSATGADLASLKVKVNGSSEPLQLNADTDIQASMAKEILKDRPYQLSTSIKDATKVAKVLLRVSSLEDSTKAQEFEGTSRFNDKSVYDVTIPESTLEVGEYIAQLIVVDTTGTEHVSTPIEYRVRESLTPDEYAFDFESGANGFAFTGDFSAGTADLQTDPKPTSENALMGLKLGSYSLGIEPSSTAQLPQLDLKGDIAVQASKIELVWHEYLDWDQAVAGVQLELNPKEGQAASLLNYPTKLSSERGTWVERRIDLTSYKGKVVNPFVFSMSNQNTAGNGFYIDDVHLELDGQAPQQQGLSRQEAFGDFTSTAPDTGDTYQGPLVADIEIAAAGLKGQTGPDGAYVFSKIKQGTYTVLVGAPGYKSKEISVSLDKKSNELEVNLEKDDPSNEPNPNADRPTAEPGAGTVGFAYDNNNPLGGAILHKTVGRGSAIQVTAPKDGVLDHVMVYAAGNNPILKDGQFEISVKQVNKLGRLIDLMKPQLVQAKSGTWNRFDFRDLKLAMQGDVYVVVKQVSPSGASPAVALDKSVSRNTSAYARCFIYNGDFNSMASAGYPGAPMIRAYFATGQDVHDQDPINPTFDTAISTTPTADPLIEEGQAAKDIVTIGDYDISPSRGMIVAYHKVQEVYEKQPKEERVISVPDTIGGVKITQIGPGVYKAPSWQGGEIERIEIPEGITCIHENAFEKSGAKEVMLPSTLEYIYSGAFKKARFSSLNLPGSLKHIGQSAFESCSELTSIDIPDSVETIETGAFKGDNYGSAMKLEHVKLPNNPKYSFISSQLFQNNKNLKSIDIPKHIKGIGLYAFEKAGLESLVLPEGLTTIGESAFNANKIKEVYLPDSLEEIGNDAFAGNYKSSNEIEELKLPANLKYIGRSAFESNKIKTVILPDKVETVRFGAFSDNPIETVRLNKTIMPEVGSNGKFRGLSPNAFPSATTLSYYDESQISDEMRSNLTPDPADPNNPPTKFVKLSDADSQKKTLSSSDNTFKLTGSAINLGTATTFQVEKTNLADDDLAQIAALPGAPNVLQAYNLKLTDVGGQPVDPEGSFELAVSASAAGSWNNKLLVYKPYAAQTWTVLPLNLNENQAAVHTLSRLGTLALAEVADTTAIAPNPNDIDYGVPSSRTIKDPEVHNNDNTDDPANPNPSDPNQPGGSNNSGQQDQSDGQTGTTAAGTSRHGQSKRKRVLPDTSDSGANIGGLLLISGAALGGALWVSCLSRRRTQVGE